MACDTLTVAAIRRLTARLIPASLLLMCGCMHQCWGPISNGNSQKVTDLARGFRLDRPLAQQQLEMLTQAPHPLGSTRQQIVGQILARQAEHWADFVELQEFTSLTPNPMLLNTPDAPAPLTIERKGTNIIATLHGLASADQKACAVLIGSHYDTKITEGFEYLGANDSGSSTLALMQMLRYFDDLRSEHRWRCDMVFVWFDGEESVLPEWSDGERRHPLGQPDHTYGSRFFVDELKPCQNAPKQWCYQSPDGRVLAIQAAIIVDMIGSPDLRISQEMYSSPSLRRILNRGMEHLGYQRHRGEPMHVEDDHIPFVRKGIAALNIIDFDNAEHWHQPTDLPEQISLESIEIASQIAIYLLLTIIDSPQEL